MGSGGSVCGSVCVVCIALAISMAPASCASAPAVGSIGARLGRDNDTEALYIRSVPEGFAASEAGLEPGDEILMIDGSYVRTMATDDLEARLRGPIGSSVSLTVARGSRILRVELKRTALGSAPAIAKPKEQAIEP